MIRKGMWKMLVAALVVLIPWKTAAELFFEEKSGLWDAVLPWVFVGVCLVLFFVCRLDKRTVMRFRPRPCPVAGAAALLSSVAILWSSLYSLLRLVRQESDATAVSLAGDQPLLGSLCSIVGFMAALVMAAWGVSLFRSGALFRDYPIVALAPPIWACLELAFLFVTYTAQSEISKNFYSIFPFALALLFLFAQSSFFSDAGGGTARRKLYQYGSPFVLMGMGSSIPSLIQLAMGRDSGSSLSIPMLITLLALSLYALASMAAIRRDTNLLLRPGRGTSPVRNREPGLSMTMELERVLADWKQSNEEKTQVQTDEEEKDSQSETDIL